MTIRAFKPSKKEKVGLLSALALSNDPVSASNQLAEGFDFAFIGRIVKQAQIKQITVMKAAGIDRGTLSRHTRARTKWTGASAVKVYNAARIIDATLNLFDQDKQKAENWLNTPAIALGGISPADYARYPLGQEAVIDLIGRIKHGVII
ncbi:antitoxin Xre/MbcA/ParS toxin-binding domain-containing protein [Marinomonas shanghaiensis]|jgi:putative toxin-antitoxin system antitoxin component (TIGR02293 family)|uniref:antitoxin Xre/MbcA/ParS toxin-binding domain-containing protein n=1 Tax=Marinomonas shanghaiensis TaxID=2202418 RepID=UPI000DBAD48F|nr:antitoxin Xre/MbcA/ParS toxin-binding domain-containing protein [Marinomonas shanghaiensis]